MHEDSNTDGIEEIPLNSVLRNWLELSAFPEAQLEYEVPVMNVRPCPRCGEAIARVRLGSEVRTVNAFRDELRSIHRPAWKADVLSEHECGAGL